MMTDDELDDYAERVEREAYERRKLIEERDEWKKKAVYWKREAITATAKLGEIRILVAMEETKKGNAYEKEK